MITDSTDDMVTDDIDAANEGNARNDT